MSNYSEDYLTLRSSSEPQRSALILDMRPRAESVQWWIAMVEAAETEARRKLRDGRSVADALNFAIFLLESGVRSGVVSTCREAYWFIRFARTAIDFGLDPATLPEQLTADGAARQALASLPLTSDQAVALSRKLDAEFDEGVDRLPGPTDRVLAEIGLVLASLGWVHEAIVDAELAAEVSQWLQVYREMTPPGE